MDITNICVSLCGGIVVAIALYFAWFAWEVDHAVEEP